MDDSRRKMRSEDANGPLLSDTTFCGAAQNGTPDLHLLGESKPMPVAAEVRSASGRDFDFARQASLLGYCNANILMIGSYSSAECLFTAKYSCVRFYVQDCAGGRGILVDLHSCFISRFGFTGVASEKNGFDLFSPFGDTTGSHLHGLATSSDGSSVCFRRRGPWLHWSRGT